MQDLSSTRIPVPPGSPVYLDGARIMRDSDGNVVHFTKALSSLDESGIIAVDDPPDSVLGALLFWAGKDWVTVPDPERQRKSYRVECTDAASQTMQWMLPSMFPIREYEINPPPIHVVTDWSFGHVGEGGEGGWEKGLRRRTATASQLQ